MHQIEVEEQLINAVKDAGIEGYSARCPEHEGINFQPELCFNEERLVVRAQACQTFRCGYHYRTTSPRYDELAEERRLKALRDLYQYQKLNIKCLTYYEHEPLRNFVARLQRELIGRRALVETKAS